MLDIESILKLALKYGASEAEIYLLTSRAVSLKTSDKIISSSTSKVASLGIRAAVGKKVAVVGTQDISDEGIKKAVEAAVHIARASPEDPDWKGFNEKVGSTPIEGLWDKETAEAGPEVLKEVADSALQAVFEGSKYSRPVRGSFTTSLSVIEIVNSYGGPVRGEGTSATMSINVKAVVDGREGTFNDFDASVSLKKLRSIQIASEAGKKAPEFAKATRIRTGTYDVILDTLVASSIINVMLSPALSALNIQEGRSPLKGKLLSEVLSPKLIIEDVGIDPELVSSRNFDDEGYPINDKIVFDGGVLRTYLYDTYTAKKEGVESTGNAWRTYSSNPAPSPNHLVVQPGDSSLSEMISEVKEGVYVLRTIGEWLSNPVSGNLNATVTHAYLIRNGEIQGTCKGFVISGNFYRVFKDRVSLLSKEFRHSIRVSSPHMLIEKIKLAGE